MKINDLQQVIAQTDNSCFHCSKGGRKSFKVIFRLSNGIEVEGCSGIKNEGDEGRRAFLIIRNALPSRIIFDGNLAY